MRDQMVNRGPDGADTWVDVDAKIGLGHRRLSIIDLSMLLDNLWLPQMGATCLTFNGEIYNHQEIREELIALGHNSWKTDHSDTEVLLYAFAQWA